MPIDHYKMTIQAKPLESLGSKHDSGSDQVLLGISRPLGHLRKTRSLANAVVDNPKPKPPEDQFPQIHGVGFYDSEDEMSSKGSTVSKDTNRSKNSQRRGSVSSVGISKSQVFENRYKLAAARSQPDSTKPANMYTKRVVYLPMFRINLETYVGESEDHKAVETTRQSLKKILDNSRSKMKSPDKIANKLREYFKQQEIDTIKKQEKEQENEISRKEMLRVSFPKTPFAVDTNAIRIPSVPFDKIQGPDSKVEALDLTSVGDDDVCSVLSSKTNKTKLSDHEHQHYHSERGTPSGLPKQYFGPFIYGKESETERAPQNYATYSDIRKMRQKGRLKVVAKSNGSAKTTRSTNSDQQDVKDWISIQSKPVLKYTTPQPAKTKLDPIVVPSQGCSECPMCKAAQYNKSTEPTNAPPNSPTPKQPPIEEIYPEIQAVHKVMVQRSSNNPEITAVQKVNMQPDNDNSSPKSINLIPTHENFSRKLGANRGPEVQVKRATLHSEALPVSKVTVKLSKAKIGNMKDLKLTKSNSSSTQSINEL